ncbi:hypothetical protein K435DRAFT_206844 [Dendrothele bispora CBS 962.96]|uniref:Uncharacterized protein n=1 Tax=Dendrothele bispora (strain CBS 962.96) TaxID=1314807 RepID=A0A4S8KL22_DENBC|nr:hypothetical protein K435DRAFT_206844 [Dendrothele bispora CBS 962.96]
MPRRKTRSQVAHDLVPATTRSGIRFHAQDDSEPPRSPLKARKGPTRTTRQNNPESTDTRPKPRPKTRCTGQGSAPLPTVRYVALWSREIPQSRSVSS